MSAGWYVAVSAVVGVAAGFQGIYERFRSDSWKACRTYWGLTYLVIRGGLAAAAFFAVPLIPVLSQPLLLRAVVAGAGAEAILRSRFYLARTKKKSSDKQKESTKKKESVSDPRSSAEIQELIGGPFDLLRFFQDFILTTIEVNARWETIQLVESFVDRWKSFPEMLRVLDLKLIAWEDLQAAVSIRAEVEALRAEVEELRSKYPPTVTLDEDKQFRCRLCYKVKAHFGDNSLKRFFRE